MNVMLSGTGRFACELAREVEAPLHGHHQR